MAKEAGGVARKQVVDPFGGPGLLAGRVGWRGSRGQVIGGGWDGKGAGGG